MIKLTKKMKQVLEQADLEKNGEINNVPMSTMYGLETRDLITPDWRRAGTRVTCSTSGGAFPTYSRVGLTAPGLRAARSLQGLRPDL